MSNGMNTGLYVGRYYTEGELARAVRRLSFPAPLEEAFLSYYHEKTVLFIRIAGLFGVLLYLANITTDFNSFPGLEGVSLAIRIGYSLFASMAVVITFFPALRSILQFYLFLVMVTGSAGIAAFTFLGSGIYASLYHSGIMLVLVFTFAFVRLRFRPASLAGLVIGVGYVVPHAVIGDLPANQLSHNAMNLVGTIAVGMCIAYLNEYHLRDSFVKGLIIDEKSRSLESRTRQIDREMEIAKTIQEHFLPAPRPGLPIGSRYRPVERIGGDFFDFIGQPDPDEIGLFISDVSGHGIPAALYTAMLRVALSQASAHHHDPQGLLERLDRGLGRHVGDAFITCFYGILNIRTGELRYANGGHLPPLVVARDSIQSLPCPPSVPLGMFSRQAAIASSRSFTTEVATLPAGGKLLLFTDGLTEARQPAQQDRLFDEIGLVESIVRARDLPAQDFTDALFADLVRFRGGESFEDDVCIICVDVA